METEKETRFRPIREHVVIERDDAKSETAGGIVLPEGAKDKPRQGAVVAVGPGRAEKGQWVRLQVQSGDRVLFGADAGTEVEIDGTKYIVMHEQEILSILQ